MKETTIIASDGLQLSLAICEAPHPRLLLQLIHGAAEHKERYYDFMEFLSEKGITSIISDNRGHGKSVDEHYSLGYMDGYGQMVADQLLITNTIKTWYNNLPLALFGHSLGSMFARIYLQDNDDQIIGLVLSGTVAYVPLVPLGVTIGEMVVRHGGEHGYSHLFHLVNGNSEEMDWVSVSETNRQARRSDPLCFFPYQNEAMLTIFETNRQLNPSVPYHCTKPNLPILSVSGEGDPVTGGKLGLKETRLFLKLAGYKNVQMKTYPHMRHEILNEDGHMIVYQDIADFLYGLTSS